MCNVNSIPPPHPTTHTHMPTPELNSELSPLNLSLKWKCKEIITSQAIQLVPRVVGIEDYSLYKHKY